jgi:transcriptional regulator with XRE-family HTH domain
MLLAKRIKAIREYRGITQIELSDKLDIEQSTYSGYEREAGNLKFTTIIRIAEALECSVPFLTDVDSEIYDYTIWKSAIR